MSAQEQHITNALKMMHTLVLIQNEPEPRNIDNLINDFRSLAEVNSKYVNRSLPRDQKLYLENRETWELADDDKKNIDMYTTLLSFALRKDAPDEIFQILQEKGAQIAPLICHISLPSYLAIQFPSGKKEEIIKLALEKKRFNVLHMFEKELNEDQLRAVTSGLEEKRPKAEKPSSDLGIEEGELDKIENESNILSFLQNISMGFFNHSRQRQSFEDDKVAPQKEQGENFTR